MSPYKSQNQYFIYCVGQCPERIHKFTASMASHGIPAKALRGRYLGQNEQSFVSRLEDLETVRPWLDAEESILELYDFDICNQPHARLRFLGTGKIKALGKMVQVSKDEALAHHSFSFDPANGSYFVCKAMSSLDCVFNL